MTPIPDHLLSHLWYPGHLAYVASLGLAPRHDPGGAAPTKAHLADADFTVANLSGADLTGADLRRADLSGANLFEANLYNADLSGANLRVADGIRSAGPVGVEGRTIYGVAHPGGPMIQAGCHWGTLDATIAAVEARYADGTGREHLRADYLAALAWVGGVR